MGGENQTNVITAGEELLYKAILLNTTITMFNNQMLISLCASSSDQKEPLIELSTTGTFIYKRHTPNSFNICHFSEKILTSRTPKSDNDKLLRLSPLLPMCCKKATTLRVQPFSRLHCIRETLPGLNHGSTHLHKWVDCTRVQLE